MDDEDSQLLLDESNFNEIFVKCEPITDFTSTGNHENTPRPPPDKRMKVVDPLEIHVSSEEPSKPDSPHEVMCSPRRKRKKQVELDSFEREILEILRNNKSKLDYSIHDPDAMFFVSHVPIIKKFNPRVKLDFQVKFMQLLQSYSLPSVRMAMGNQSLSTPSEFRNVEESSSNDCEQQ